MSESFEQFFERATGFKPFPYQTRLATDGQTMPSLVSVPTGMGKTAGVVLAWLWRRRFAGAAIRDNTPRRLAYCLPMRVLVEQTHTCAATWLHGLGLLGGSAEFESDESGRKRLKDYDPWAGDNDPSKIRVHVLMGGDVDRDWDMYPERDAILVGTQDMLLSRALNRGYAMSRFRWPVQFGLLNNDCLWVLDEVQLMGNGLGTTAQLQAFRRRMGTTAAVQSTWMSATMRPEWLATVDFAPELDALGMAGIDDKDRRHKVLEQRLEATKRLERAQFKATKDGKAEADLALDRHTPGSRTLIVVNTVKRAQSIYQALSRRKPAAHTLLIHSRFRPGDRAAAVEALTAAPGPGGTIAVCTQAVEAGVDVSAKLLITDLAPWASLVQRFGRCNREGEFNAKRDAAVVWVEPEGLRDDRQAAPYANEDLRRSAARLGKLSDAGPRALPPVTENLAFTHVIRRKDMIDLFDTTPDLAGADIDVSRFIRDADEHDVQAFWRDVPKDEAPSADEARPSRPELCSVPVGDVRGRQAWRWDHLTRQWRRPDAIYPGLVLMLRASEGGYDPTLGWTAKAGSTEPLQGGRAPSEHLGGDRYSEARQWETIAAHTDGVVATAAGIVDSVKPITEPWRQDLLTAARWHDVGKGHAVFQAAIPEGAPRADLWAKATSKLKPYARRGFRHEVASAIAMLLNDLPDLAAYLAAAHHGKVRLSIRSLPHETRPGDAEKRFARAIWDGDRLPATDLGGGTTSPETVLDLSFMELGDGPHGPSWLARMLALRDDPRVGPFRLAFLEALLRVADWRASGEPEGDSEEAER